MRLRSLRVDGVRNLAPLALDTDAPFVVAVGRNAQGKTNLLECVYLLATLKPMRGLRLADAVAWGGASGRIGGDLSSCVGRRVLHLEFSKAERTLHLDGAPVTDAAGWSALRVVAFTPDDVAIGSGEPARRRAWLDRAAFTATPAHLASVRRYRRVVEQKGAALRQGAASMVLDALDEALVEAGTDLVARRARLLHEIGPYLADVHAAVAPGSELTLRYRTAEDLAASVAAMRVEERRRGAVLAGPQTDDVEFRVDDRPVRTWGSRGQLRSVVLALKLAEVAAGAARGDAPVFLFDDVGSELDAERTGRLLGRLAASGAQVFASSTRAEPLTDRVPGALWLSVEAGRVTVDPTPAPR